tara:strand:+ start:989 stop:1252 length:264 start_codon:yes stop_codon:yes gene_type:complete
VQKQGRVVDERMKAKETISLSYMLIIERTARHLNENVSSNPTPEICSIPTAIFNKKDFIGHRIEMQKFVISERRSACTSLIYLQHLQ